ncbi:KAT8 regulatory NSL complex subunit 3 [Sitophilus oryzae]|uniref:KAT8 regulatory NSL complex subunit 3 n=1 Tax=Sitophilus oryzae TaxID=7048 RepID=A0A6J2YLA7_SITOR|nr:KAT8 regulatory NSL complex subunit 3 [Sitophilus oryzae]
MQPKQSADNEQAKYTYPIQMTNPFERESWLVATDHCYARPWNWKSESPFLKPTKNLFMDKNYNSKFLFSNATSCKDDSDIDIELLSEPTAPTYDMTKAINLMEESEKHTSLVKSNSDDNWEEQVSKINWTSSQHRLFNGFVNNLNGLYLSKLAQLGVSNEPILRRTVIDKAVQKTRRLFAAVSYDSKLLQWLHQLLLDSLDQQHIALYLDILQTLKAKIPKFVEIMLTNQNISARAGCLSNDSLVSLLKKPWDPVASSLVQDKPKKLPGNPVLVLVPCSPHVTKRQKRWVSLLSHLGQVVTVPTNFNSGSHRMTMTSCIDQMFALSRGRIQEVRESCPNRNIILVGVGAGAALALQLAHVENIFCVVSLGFSLLTVEGRRGEPDDSILELQCPVLFVIGQSSSTSLQEDMEDLRERMRIETGFIVVGSADNNLIVSQKKKREEGITQSIVDKCITDEIGEFISGLILSPFPPQIRQSPTNISTEIVAKKSKGERKRYNSTASSVESEPPSPMPKITRPVGRPAGKAKSRLDSKWVMQDASNLKQPTNISPITTSTLNSKGDINTFMPISSDTVSVGENIAFSNTSPQKPDQQPPVKKIKTLKPLLSSDIVDKSGLKVGLKQDASGIPFNINRTTVVSSSQLSTLLQSGVSTYSSSVPQTRINPSSTIKVLENVQLSNQATAKLISSPGGCPIDLSKLSLTTQKNSGGNLVLLPDGKIKSVNSVRPMNMKTQSGMMLSVPQVKGSQKMNKYVISKRLQGTMSSRTVKRDTFVSLPQTVKTTLPPPTNLSTQDIMDLPIIFADDNQILDPNVPNDLSTNEAANQSVSKFMNPISNKYVIVTKPTTSGVKRSNPMSAASRPPLKYTKIILSKKPGTLSVDRLPSDVSNMNATLDSSDIESEELHAQTKSSLDTISAINADKSEVQLDDDPDYVPPKSLKY